MYTALYTSLKKQFARKKRSNASAAAAGYNQPAPNTHLITVCYHSRALPVSLSLKFSTRNIQHIKLKQACRVL